MTSFVAAACLGAASLGCQTVAPPTRVILFVGDGAGVGHWTVGRLARDTLAVEAFSVTGLVDTRGADHLVTGSAPAATAFAIGERTRMKAVGVGPDTLPRTTVLEYARERGLSTGLVTTTYVTDATPAAFATHWPNRDHLEIARQMSAQQLTVLLGGGREMFDYATEDGSPNPLTLMRSRYTYVETPEAFATLDLDTVSALLGLFAQRDMELAPDRHPSLAEMTRTAIAMVDRNPRGFFLLVENEETDTQTHHNEPYDTVAAEMVALDDAIRVAMEYRARQPNTLILVTGDHETGGLSVLDDEDGRPRLRYTTLGHSANMVPIFAHGPSAERFGGLLTSDEVGRHLIAIVRRGGGT